jgi:hypothetical protein
MDMNNKSSKYLARHAARLAAASKSASVASALAASLLLAACGGGGSAGDAASSVAATSSATPASSATASTTPSDTAAATSATPDNPAAVTATTSNVTTASTTKPIFYGVNGHNNEGGAYDISSPALQLSQLQTLGARLYRNEVYNQASATKLAGIAKTMAAGGITVFPILLSGIDYNSESDAYNAGYTLGRQTATAYRYAYYEVSNELGADALTGNVDGVYPEHFDNTKFQKARGVIRGMIDGIRSVDSTGKIVMGGGAWMHYGFDQMLANGTQPDGSSGHPALNWDITAWHWYSDQGDITHACGGTGCHDVLAALQQLGKPIWLTEFGVRPEYGTDDQIAAYLVGNTMMAQFVAVASKYDLQAIQAYQLYDDPDGGEGAYGLLKNDGKTQKASFAAYKSFVANNPR